MAQIVTITNPLTGQPAQVDQLDHTAQQIDDAIARALPGGPIDIALSNKLGCGKRLYASDDLNDIKTPGLYWWSDAPSNAPISNACMLVYDAYDGECIVQEIHTYLPSGYSWDFGGSVILRQIYATFIGQWEWSNPPMALGAEYRTTERYMGKPVYAMIIDCGMSEDNKTIRVTPENGLGTLIRGDVVLGGEPAFYIAGNDFSNSYSRYANVEQNGGKIEITLRQGSSYGSMQTCAIVYYTKE